MEGRERVGSGERGRKMRNNVRMTEGKKGDKEGSEDD